MKKLIAVVTALSMCGCVSQQSQKALADAQTGCAAGNADACTAAGYQAQANQQEQQANSAIAVGIGSALLAGAAAGAIIANQNERPVYASPVYVRDRGHWHY